MCPVGIITEERGRVFEDVAWPKAEIDRYHQRQLPSSAVRVSLLGEGRKEIKKEQKEERER